MWHDSFETQFNFQMKIFIKLICLKLLSFKNFFSVLAFILNQNGASAAKIWNLGLRSPRDSFTHFFSNWSLLQIHRRKTEDCESKFIVRRFCNCPVWFSYQFFWENVLCIQIRTKKFDHAVEWLYLLKVFHFESKISVFENCVVMCVHDWRLSAVA